MFYSEIPFSKCQLNVTIGLQRWGKGTTHLRLTGKMRNRASCFLLQECSKLVMKRCSMKKDHQNHQITMQQYVDGNIVLNTVTYSKDSCTDYKSHQINKHNHRQIYKASLVTYFEINEFQIALWFMKTCCCVYSLQLNTFDLYMRLSIFTFKCSIQIPTESI